MATKEREPGRDDAKVATPLEQKVIDAIAKDIPVNLTCHHCEREAYVEEVLDPNSRWDREDWIKLATKLISIVKEEVNENQRGQ